MKSFDKFQHERTDLLEVKIFKKMSSTGVSPNAGNNPGLRKTAETGRQLDPRRALPSSPTKPLSPNVRSGESTGPQRQQRAKAMGQKAGPAPRGIARVMDRTKKKIQTASNTETGRKVGRALQGAGKEILDYKPDRERTDTGAGGMGTALRQMTGIGQAAVQGALKAPSERINPKQKKTLGGKLGLKAKERFQTAIGVKPTSRTEFGGKVTGDTSKQAAKERVSRIKRGVTRSVDSTGLTKTQRQQKQKEAERQVTGVGTPPDQDRKRRIQKTMVNLGNRLTRDRDKPQRVITKTTPKTEEPPADIKKQLNEPQKPQPRSYGGKLIDTLLGNKRNFSNQTTKKTPPKLQSAAINPEVVGRENTSVSKPNKPASNQTVDVTATRVNDEMSGSKKPNQISGSRTAGSLPPASSTRKIAGQRNVKRRNIASSEFKDKDGKFNYKAYKAAQNRVETKKGGGRPVMRQSNQLNLFTGKRDKPRLVNQKTGRELNKNKENKALKKNDPKPKENFKQSELKLESKKMNFTKILEANRIAAEREIKNQHGSVTGSQMRTYDQMKKAKASADLKTKLRTGSVMVQNDESYSHWREEFIWETDKKFPDKVKEIKPMSGKNNITINPEDETSKYKRGY
tara:strand:+ start:34 stop:1914 length:1881 start_codon:yes stop_codon:yes gene_type:complete